MSEPKEVEVEEDVQEQDTAEAPAPVEEAKPQPLDVDSLSVEDKYKIVVTNLNQSGAPFLLNVSPTTLKMDLKDPLTQMWIAFIASWNGITNHLNSYMVANGLVQEASEESKEQEEGVPTDEPAAE